MADANSSIGVDLRELGRFDEAERALRSALNLPGGVPGSGDGADRASIPAG